MKNMFSKINKKELFLIFLAPVSFISIFFLTETIQNLVGEPETIIYLNKGILLLLLILISIFSIKMPNTTTKIYENKKKQCILTTILIILAGLYIVSFIHPTGQGIFFLEIFVPSLIINMVLTYLITLVISGLKK